MKLYQYHHCPYCVRADMVANYKQVPHEKVYLLNDDEQTCFGLINAKMVPILQFDDGSAMGESLDIVAKLDAMGNSTRPISPQIWSASVLAQFDGVAAAIRYLLFPRNLKLGLPEFATQSACDYFQTKKEKLMNTSFDKAWNDTAVHLALVNEMLACLPELPIQSHLSMDDVLVYPMLRNLSMVKDIAFKAQTTAYLTHIATLTETDLYFDKAI